MPPRNATGWMQHCTSLTLSFPYCILKTTRQMQGASNSVTGLGRRSSRLAESLRLFPSGVVFHIHIPISPWELPQHLGKPFLLCFGTFRAGDPADVVILLVGWPRLVRCHQISFDERVAHESRHWISLTFQPRPLLTLAHCRITLNCRCSRPCPPPAVRMHRWHAADRVVDRFDRY